MVKGYEEEGAPRLKRFLPRLHGQEEEARKLTLAAGLYDWVHEDGPGDVFASMKSVTRAQFGDFVKGELVDNCVFMKRVEDSRRGRYAFDHGVWAIRGFRGEPQYRYFGVFPLTNWFLALTKDDRGSEPPRICRRPQLLRDWSHDESQDNREVFLRGA